MARAKVQMTEMQIQVEESLQRAAHLKLGSILAAVGGGGELERAFKAFRFGVRESQRSSESSSASGDAEELQASLFSVRTTHAAEMQALRDEMDALTKSKEGLFAERNALISALSMAKEDAAGTANSLTHATQSSTDEVDHLREELKNAKAALAAAQTE